MNRKAKRGFTLVEVLAVVVIMAILAAGVFMMMGAGDTKSKIAETNAQIQALTSLLEDYRNLYGDYPYVVPDVRDNDRKRLNIPPGYAYVNFTFKVQDGDSCTECGNAPGDDKAAFGLAARFVPPAMTISNMTANTNMASHYESCYSNPGSQSSEVWERELGSKGDTLQNVMMNEASDSNLDRINRAWRRLENQKLVYSKAPRCTFCQAEVYSAGANNDAWGNALFYDTTTKAIVSAGPDGKFGTDDDISGAGTGTEDED